MRRLIIATKNKGKVGEIKELLRDTGFDILTMLEAGVDRDIEENGGSFEENSLIKARAIHEMTGGFVLADDSGLEIDFLNRAPGIYTARFLGENAKDSDRFNAVLTLLEGIPDEYRGARFVCAASFVYGSKKLTVRGTLEGKIAYKAAGANGFGYDPIFWVPEYQKTLAELDSDVKNEISHRGKAFREFADRLKTMESMGLI